jgi:MFS transporter, ACS family, tartrate transporter
MNASIPERSELERATIGRITRRLLPLLALLFVVNFLDRTNVSFAALSMSNDLKMSPATYGLGAGIFFIGYFLCEVPSNIALHHFGARRWLARIIISWGVVAMLMASIRNEWHFLGLRVLLGIAEAGFYPGVIYFLSLWFPARYRARMAALFYLAVPIAQVIGAPMATGLIAMGDSIGVVGWRLMFLAEGLPAILLGAVVLAWLTDRPSEANWLSAEQRLWLSKELLHESSSNGAVGGGTWRQLRQAISNPHVLALALIYFGITLGSNSMNFFLPSILQTYHLSSAASGLLTAIPYAIAAVAMILWSRHSDRSRERRFHAGGAAMLAAASLALAITMHSWIFSLIGFSLMAAAVYSAINIFWAVPPQLLSGVGAAAGIGMINSIGNLSGFGGSYFIGAIYQRTGSYVPAFLAIAACMFTAGLGFVVLMGRLQKR